MSLAEIARQTLAIIERGDYRTPSGAAVELRARIDAAVAGTRLYRPGDLDALLGARLPARAASPLRIEVTGETTGAAARRLLVAEGEARVAALNFASAKNPGGGFLGGAKAQEEDLARCSALYACQITQPVYYEANRAHASMLYTDHLIYSPDVPFFRDEALDLVEAPFHVSIVTAPAPNAGEALRRDPRATEAIRETLRSRAGRVLAVLAAHGHRCVVLGAWGCGVFRNDPADVASAFAGWLESDAIRSAFERVVFAVYDRGAGQPNRRAFEARFGGAWGELGDVPRA
jgi:uncharacterized protein (TIGR02452 family)